LTFFEGHIDFDLRLWDNVWQFSEDLEGKRDTLTGTGSIVLRQNTTGLHVEFIDSRSGESPVVMGMPADRHRKSVTFGNAVACVEEHRGTAKGVDIVEEHLSGTAHAKQVERHGVILEHT